MAGSKKKKKKKHFLCLVTGVQVIVYDSFFSARNVEVFAQFLYFAQKLTKLAYNYEKYMFKNILNKLF